MKLLKFFTVAFVQIISSVCNAQSGYSLDTKISLKGNSSWDYMKIDESSSRLFISHGDRANIVDLNSNKEIAEILNLNEGTLKSLLSRGLEKLRKKCNQI